MVEHALAVGGVEDAVLESHDAACGDLELQVRVGLAGLHARHGTAGLAEGLDDLAGELVGALHHGQLHGFQPVAVLILLEEHAGAAHLELEALAAHGLHEDGEVQDAAAGHLDTGLVAQLLDAHGHVVLGLAHEALLELAGAHDVAVAAHEGARGGLEDHGEGGRVDLDGLQLHGALGVGVDVADVGAVDAHHGADVAGADLVALGAAEVVEGEELLGLGHGAAAVVLDHEDLLAGVDGAGVDAADADAPHVAGVVDGDALHGQRAVGVAVGGGQAVHDHVQQGVHVVVAVVRGEAGEAVDGARVDHVLHGELELPVGGAEVHHEVEGVVDHGLRAGARAVDLVDHDHDGEAGVDGVAQHEARLGHGALEGVHEEQGGVGHTEHALHLAAEVGVARGVDDVDLDALVLDGDVLGQDGDAALALLVVGVEDTVLHLLVCPEGVGGPQQLVDEGGLAMVDVGDDGDVSQVLLQHGALFLITAVLSPPPGPGRSSGGRCPNPPRRAGGRPSSRRRCPCPQTP